MSRPALEVAHVSRTISQPHGRDLRLLHDVSLSVGPGESLCIMGKSGSGKTTLLSIMGLLTNGYDGEVCIAGEPTRALPDAYRARLRNEHIGFIFQSYSLIAHLSIAENVALPFGFGSPVSRREQGMRVESALETVGLAGRGRDKPRALSGGEQQRVAIARSLVREPAIVLADEPTGALDERTAETVLELLFQSITERRASLVIVTHDPGVAALGHRRAVMSQGHLIEESSRPRADA